MKKLIVFVMAIAVIVAAAFGVAVKYVKPSQELDLNYQEVAVGDKIVDILKNRKFEVELTEAEISDLLKKQLAARSELPHHIRVEGATARLHGSVLEADVNFMWRDRIPVGATLFFNLSWNSPNIEIIHTGTQIKNMKLPASLLRLPDIRIPIEEHLPKLVGVREVYFEPSSVRLDLKLGQ